MTMTPPLPLPARPDRSEPEQLPAWTWTVPPQADDECRHGLADRAWCSFCRSAVPPASRPEAQS